jgi:3-hydroxybutyrate dehydrogenase
VQKQIDDKAVALGISQEEAKAQLLAEKQPSGEFVTQEALAGLAIFLCGSASNEVRGAAWNMDGGWTAQ